MSKQITKAEFFATLDEMGEELVRERLARSHFGDGGDRRAMVTLWLERKDQERAEARERRNEDSSSESLRIARSAKNAAWTAAIMATVAAAVAIVAAVISYLALTASR